MHICVVRFLARPLAHCVFEIRGVHSPILLEGDGGTKYHLYCLMYDGKSLYCQISFLKPDKSSLLQELQRAGNVIYRWI